MIVVEVWRLLCSLHWFCLEFTILIFTSPICCLRFGNKCYEKGWSIWCFQLVIFFFVLFCLECFRYLSIVFSLSFYILSLSQMSSSYYSCYRIMLFSDNQASIINHSPYPLPSLHVQKVTFTHTIFFFNSCIISSFGSPIPIIPCLS